MSELQHIKSLDHFINSDAFPPLPPPPAQTFMSYCRFLINSKLTSPHESQYTSHPQHQQQLQRHTDKDFKACFNQVYHHLTKRLVPHQTFDQVSLRIIVYAVSSSLLKQPRLQLIFVPQKSTCTNFRINTMTTNTINRLTRSPRGWSENLMSTLSPHRPGSRP